MLSLIITFEFFYRALFPKYIIKPNNGNDHRTLVCTKKKMVSNKYLFEVFLRNVSVFPVS